MIPRLPPLPALPPQLRPVGVLLLPLAVLAVAALLLEPASRLELTTRRLLVYLPYALLLVTAGLAHYFNRSRELACAVLLICAYWLIRTRLQTPLDEPVPQAIYALIGVLVPVAVLVQFLATERGLWTPRSLRLVLLGPALLQIGVLVYGGSALHAERLVAWFPAKPLSGYVLSPGASAFFGVALATMLALMALRQARLQPALPGALACVFCALAFFQVPLISTLMFCAAAVILVAGVLQNTHEMAYRDPLTGLLGRRALEERLLGLGPRYTLAMLDVDHFKRFNDTHGHEAGDDTLKMVAKHLARVGGGGTAYRYGGEEFCVVFPRRGLTECKPHLERLRGAIEDYPLTLRDTTRRPDDTGEGARRRGAAAPATHVSVTVSIGLAEPDADDDTPELVLRTADRALYAAKEAGRNRIAYFAETEAEA